jgi:hypothetical protein
MNLRTSLGRVTSEDAPRYRAVHAYLSDDAHETWQQVAGEYGVSVSGLIEALGLDLQNVANDQALADRLPDLVRRARRIDAERRRRTGRSTTTSAPS